MAETPERPQRPSGRRGFLREAFLKMAGPAADMLDQAVPLPPERKRLGILRPPGALPETAFLRTCYRSGNCMDVCPANAIVPLKHTDPNLSGTPTILPATRACVLCDSLACMDACPSGALRPVAREMIRVGLAIPHHPTCVRSRGEDCTACIEICPIGRTAIGLDDAGRVVVSAAACTGCGMCEQVCPTGPKAIHIQPYPEHQR